MPTEGNNYSRSAFTGRIRQFGRGTPFIHVPKRAPAASVQKSVSKKVALASRSATAPKPALPRTSKSTVLQRKTIKSPAVITPKPKRARKTGGQKALVAMASVVFIAGISVAVLQLRTNHEVISQVRRTSSVLGDTTEEAVSEEEPTPAAVAGYRTDPSLPRLIRIPSLKVAARVQRQGLDKNGALKAPSNVFNAGWYENSSKPGEGGAVLLDGHVAGPTKRGVFYDIKKLRPGELIELERGDGQKFTYKVVKSMVSDASKTDMTAALLSVQDGKPGLNLMTCTGQYDHKSGEYNQRITVFAVQI